MAQVTQTVTQHILDWLITKSSSRLVAFFRPHVRIRFPEHEPGSLRRSKVYAAVAAYLSTVPAAASGHLKACMVTDTEAASGESRLLLSGDDLVEVEDTFRGVKLSWSTLHGLPGEEGRSYQLKFHRRHRNFVEEEYLDHVMEVGWRAAAAAMSGKKRRRRRRIFANSAQGEWKHVDLDDGHTRMTFDMLAMPEDMKQEIVHDLLAFRRSDMLYAKIRKPWTRRYLIQGPQGSGKTSTVEAISDMLDYHIYKLDVTSANSDTALFRLLVETEDRSVVTVEDIDLSSSTECASLKRFLAATNWLWSTACGGGGGGRLVVLNTDSSDEDVESFLQQLGSGIDMHIRLSNCGFEQFKKLATRYLGIDQHPLVGRIEELLSRSELATGTITDMMLKGMVRAGEVAVADHSKEDEVSMSSLVAHMTEEDITVCLEEMIRVLEQTQQQPKSTTRPCPKF